tara:strand:- start:793 stop:1017 length:225 start_codon:yes stop_codon:yes gene_type:complete
MIFGGEYIVIRSHSGYNIIKKNGDPFIRNGKKYKYYNSKPLKTLDAKKLLIKLNGIGKFINEEKEIKISNIVIF